MTTNTLPIATRRTLAEIATLAARVTLPAPTEFPAGTGRHRGAVHRAYGDPLTRARMTDGRHVSAAPVI